MEVGEPPVQYDWFLNQGEIWGHTRAHTHTHTHRTPSEDGSQDGGDVSATQGMPRIATRPPRLRERCGAHLLWSSEGTSPVTP